MLLLATQLEMKLIPWSIVKVVSDAVENWIFHALNFSPLCKQGEKEQTVKNGILPRRLETTKTSLISIFKVSHLKIHTELSVSKIFFHEIVQCHIKHIEIEALHVYTKVTQQAKPMAKLCFSH